MRESQYVLTSEAARLLDSSSDNVRRLERRGKLKAAIKTAAGVRLFSREDVERLAMERTRRLSASQAPDDVRAPVAS